MAPAHAYQTALPLRAGADGTGVAVAEVVADAAVVHVAFEAKDGIGEVAYLVVAQTEQVHGVAQCRPFADTRQVRQLFYSALHCY